MKTEIPDYKLAAADLDSLFASLNLTVEISNPVGEVQNDWAYIKYDVKIAGQSFQWRMGIGHVDWKKAASLEHVIFGGGKLPGYVYKNILHAMAEGKTILSQYHSELAQLAAQIALKQSVKPNPAEVFARVCAEGREAEQETFESWASNFGYSSDSIKAKKTYDECRENGCCARRIVSGQIFDQLADLAQRL